MKNEEKLALIKKKQEKESESKTMVLYTTQSQEELQEIRKAIESLAEALDVHVDFPNVDKLLNKLEKLEDLPDSFQEIKSLAENINKSLKTMEVADKEVSIRGFRELWESLVRQNNKIDKASKEQAERTIEKFTDLQQYIDQLTLTIQQGQRPEDFKPVRLVIGGDGVPLKFLQNMPVARGGGGSSNGGGSSGGLTDAELRASPVPVEATIDTTGLATDATDSNTAAIKTAVETIDNAIAGSEMQVDVVGALPAGNNNIGDVDIATIAAGDNNIGNVDVASIAAGDNNIGNVDLASAIPAGSNNIGDVDVASITNGSLNGPGSPTIDSYTKVAINLAAGADQVLVSSSANKQIWVYGLGITVNVAGTVSFQDEDNTAITGIMPFATNGGMTVAPSGNFAMPIWKLATDKDLEVDVVTSELDGWLCYAIVSV